MDERRAWLEALKVFDQHHKQVKRELEQALKEEGGYVNGR